MGLERMERAVEQLDLPAETLGSVYAVLDDARASSRASRGQVREAHEQMRGLLEQLEPEIRAVMDQADKIGALETESRKLQLRAMLDIRALLSVEQWELLQRHMHHGRGDERGPRGSRDGHRGAPGER